MSNREKESSDQLNFAAQDCGKHSVVSDLEMLHHYFPFLFEGAEEKYRTEGRFLAITQKTIFIQQSFHLQCVYFILRGRGEIFRKIGVRSLTFNHFLPGSILGDISVAQVLPSTVNARALEPVLAYSLDVSAFRSLLGSSLSFNRALLDRAYAAINRSDHQRMELCVNSVLSRLYKVITELPPAPGTSLAEQVKVLPVHTSLAHSVGSSREVVTRNLKQLVSQGLISVSGHLVTVRD